MAFKFVFLPPQNDRTREMADVISKGVPDVRVANPETEADAEREIVDAEAAFGTISPSVLSKASRLKWLQAPAAAPAAGYYYPALIAHPVTVTNYRGIFNDRIPAQIMAYVLSFARAFHLYSRQQARSEWHPHGYDSIRHLPESTALIVGVGGIGGETARLCAAFGMRVIAVDARQEVKPEGVVEMHRPDALERLLPEADFVIVTIPHTPETEGMFNAKLLGLMKRTAYFINIGRGMTTKLDDVNAAVRNGTIAGAALDVYEMEPLPADHPLWTAPNTILTPHVADRGPHLDQRRRDILLDNVRRFAAGQTLVNVVDKANWF